MSEGVNEFVDWVDIVDGVDEIDSSLEGMGCWYITLGLAFSVLWDEKKPPR